VAAAFAGSDAGTRAELRRGLGDPDLDPAGVERLRAIIVGSGALKRAEQRIANLTEAALRALGRVRLAGEASLMLVDLAQQATRRSL
jgi:geranylgeranyl diphosphate synthase type I